MELQSGEKTTGEEGGAAEDVGRRGQVVKPLQLYPHYSDLTAQRPMKTKHTKPLVTRAESHTPDIKNEPRNTCT